MSKDINWFPGHMRKTLRSMQEQIKLVDVIIETADARIPVSSRNPELNSIIERKPRILVLNKADLADPEITTKWISYFQGEKLPVVSCNAAGKKGLDQIRKISKELCSDVLERAKAKGRMGRPVRAMVVGIPNSGKSTLINSLCNRKLAVTGDRPGVTRGYQWARTDKEMELMDMPGVLWPKIAGRKSQLNLTLTGAVKREVVDNIEVAVEGLSYLRSLYPEKIMERYRILFPDGEDGESLPHSDGYELFLQAATIRGCVMSGGRVDEERFARLFLDDFQSGRIGRISLEVP